VWAASLAPTLPRATASRPAFLSSCRAAHLAVPWTARSNTGSSAASERHVIPFSLRCFLPTRKRRRAPHTSVWAEGPQQTPVFEPGQFATTTTTAHLPPEPLRNTTNHPNHQHDNDHRNCHHNHKRDNYNHFRMWRSSGTLNVSKTHVCTVKASLDCTGTPKRSCWTSRLVRGQRSKSRS
jgi:hypothetical protein